MSKKKKTAFYSNHNIKISIIFSVFVLLTSAFFYQFMPNDSSELYPVLSEDESPPTVILDAGHGGVDSGAVSVYGTEEKNLNLEMVKKLGAFLESGGVRVIYTRTDDTMLSSHREGSRKTKDLLGRIEIAEEHPNALFLSLHMNTLPQEKYHGTQVFYTEQNSKNKALAEEIQKTVTLLLQPENTRKAKNAKSSIYILDRIKQPALLVECGFLTNFEEAKLLEDEGYQKKLAFTLSRPILDFLAKTEEN